MTLLSFNFLNSHFYLTLNNRLLYQLAACLFLLLMLTVFFLFRHRAKKKMVTKLETMPAKPMKEDDLVDSTTVATLPTSLTISSKDINAIAGEDKIATQLDLARAYIEVNRKQLARKMLDYVVEQGTPDQQQEAERLLLLLF